MKRQNNRRQNNRAILEQLSSTHLLEFQSLFTGGFSLFNGNKAPFVKEYKDIIKQLEDDYDKLPYKTELSEEQNRNFDKNRLAYISKALHFLHDYYVVGKKRFNRSLNIGEQEFDEGSMLLNSKRILECVAFTIYNLSGSLRSKYKSLLQPQPFTWETFEHFGGGMKVAPPEWLNVTIKSSSGIAANRLIEEYQSFVLITEAAIPTILKFDVPQLKKLFDYIEKCESGSEINGNNISSVKLLAIKAYTRRIVDTENLIQLLKLSDNKCTNINHREITSLIEEVGENDKSYMLEVENDDKTFERQFNLTTKLGRHAALRRLEKIGELITGKNFSSSLTKLDSTIDWQAFVVVRDTIAHQDQGDNKSKIERLLANNGLFLSILREEMQEFFTRLNQIITLRDQRLPKFKKDKETEFWQAIYTHEQKALEPVKEEKKIQARTSKENVKLIIDTLKELKAPIELQIKWVKILNGHLEIPSTKEKGELFKVLSSLRGQKPELFKQCKEIIEKAINVPSTKKSKEQIMKEQQEAKERKKIEEEQNFSGLVNLRALAQSFKDDSGPKLSHIQKVEAAIEALENIKEFMEYSKIVKDNFDITKRCNEAQYKSIIERLLIRFIVDSEFNDAVEYNAAQLLQCLDNIAKFPEAKGKKFLDQDYEFVRTLRNYIVHGNHLMEKESYDPSANDKNPVTQRQEVIANIITIFIIELLPILSELKGKMTIKQYSIDINKALATILPFSQSLRNPQQLSYHNGNIPVGSDYFSYLPSEVTTRILLYVPEVNSLSVLSIEESLAAYCKSKVPPKEEIKAILNSPEQLSYRQRLIAEREDMSINSKSM